MEQEKAISIIYPLNNASMYLKTAVFSVINQTHKNLELVFLDDGFTDNGFKLCDEFAKNNYRIKTFHKNNEGPTIPREIMIKQANGSYIAFLDSVCELNPKVLLELYKIIEECDATTYNANAVLKKDVKNNLFRKQMFGYLWLYFIKKHIVRKAIETTSQFLSTRYNKDSFFLTTCAKELKNKKGIDLFD